MRGKFSLSWISSISVLLFSLFHTSHSVSFSLPAGERSYYLPSRNSLELPWDCLIDRLCELCGKFEYAQRKIEKLAQQVLPTVSSKLDSSDSESYSVGTCDCMTSSGEISARSDHQTHSQKTSVAQRLNECKPYSDTSRSTGVVRVTGGLGWMPNRSKHRRLEILF
ncbi:hypothetical protein FGIG_05385 [Fasciola gigantica]|uniref:Uncharacterized protein n=1 Tax=Fasciola gigantica TaxID=46835 RepID=A0A504YGV9_FASGI|nr:hypothetical protein FGIG_05385 [Fasciola gigantica]